MNQNKSLKTRLYDIIFEADTPSGKLFDITLLILILTSVGVVVLESVESIGSKYHNLLWSLELIFTAIFTIEYILRIIIVNKPWKYIFSFYGIIDLISILPIYFIFFTPATTNFLIFRAIRLLRVFRLLKMTRYVSESTLLILALKNSRRKIAVFLYAVMVIVIVIGTIMYITEGPEHGFSNIPKSIYWTIVTLTTVGYGDIAPQTSIGQFIASIVMILGYAIIAVPTGIVSTEISNITRNNKNTQVCNNCLNDHHDDDARFCKKCGDKLII